MKSENVNVYQSAIRQDRLLKLSSVHDQSQGSHDSKILELWPLKTGLEDLPYDDEFSSFKGVYDYDAVNKPGQNIILADHGFPQLFERTVIADLDQDIQQHVKIDDGLD